MRRLSLACHKLVIVESSGLGSCIQMLMHRTRHFFQKVISHPALRASALFALTLIIQADDKADAAWARSVERDGMSCEDMIWNDLVDVETK